eukprot:15313865-Alexandrium_andersonii.AAC.1
MATEKTGLFTRPSITPTYFSGNPKAPRALDVALGRILSKALGQSKNNTWSVWCCPSSTNAWALRTMCI